MTKRIVAWVLAMAMVITCAVSGTVLPVVAGNGDMFDGLGAFSNTDTNSYKNTVLLNTVTGKDKTSQITPQGAIVSDPVEETNTVLRIGVSADGTNYTHASYLKFSKCDPTIVAGKEYALTFRAYGDAFGIIFSNCTVVEENDELSTKEEGYKFAGVQEWRDYTITFTPKSGIDLDYSIRLVKQADYPKFTSVAGYTYIDDITLVEVAEEEEVIATGITINKDSLDLEVGDVSEALTVTATSEGATLPEDVVWSIDPESVATIDANTGVVTAVSAGTATVTATCGELTDTMTVNVTAPEVEETSTDLINGLGTCDTDKITAAGTNHPLAALLREGYGAIVNDPSNSGRGEVLQMTYTATYNRPFRINYLYDAAEKTYTMVMDPSKTYTLSFWVYGDSVKLNFLHTHIIDHNSSKVGIKDDESNINMKFGDNTQWEYCSVTFTLHDDIAVKEGSKWVDENKDWYTYGIINFQKDGTVYGAKNGYTYIDDITLVEVAQEEESDTVTVDENITGGSLAVSDINAELGDIVTVTVTPVAGYIMVPGS